MPNVAQERTIGQFKVGDPVMINSKSGVPVLDGAYGTIVACSARANTLTVELDIELDGLLSANLPDFEFSRRVRVRPAMVDPL